MSTASAAVRALLPAAAPMAHPSEYGLWPLVVLNAALVLFFAFSFTHPRTPRDWRSFGAFAAFVVALFAEMYGVPLTLYLVAGWLGTRLGYVVDPTRHDAGHLWNVLLGWRGDPHWNPVHLASSALLAAGFVLVVRAWGVLYRAQREGRVATTGPYAAVRHPQYVGFVLVLLGFLLQWPTLPTLIMFPVLVVMYARLARREEREALAGGGATTREARTAYGTAYAEYAATTPAFVPRWRPGAGRAAAEAGPGGMARTAAPGARGT